MAIANTGTATKQMIQGGGGYGTPSCRSSRRVICDALSAIDESSRATTEEIALRSIWGMAGMMPICDGFSGVVNSRVRSRCQ